MINSDRNLILKIKDRAKEAGIIAKNSFWGWLDKTTYLLPHVVGNELVMAATLPLVPSLIVDTYKRERFQTHVSDLGKRLYDSKEELNSEFIKSVYGRKSFEDTIKSILDETEKEKIESLKNFLLNSYKQQEPDEMLTRFYFDRLCEMDVRHIQILLFFENPISNLEIIFNKRKQNNMLHVDLPKDLNTYCLKWHDKLFESAFEDLRDWGFIQARATGTYSRNDLETKKDKMIEDIVYKLDTQFTSYGKNFLKFVRAGSASIDENKKVDSKRQ